MTLSPVVTLGSLGPFLPCLGKAGRPYPLFSLPRFHEENSSCFFGSFAPPPPSDRRREEGGVHRVASHPYLCPIEDVQTQEKMPIAQSWSQNRLWLVVSSPGCSGQSTPMPALTPGSITTVTHLWTTTDARL